MIETGVAAGVSSAYILNAIELNQFGELYSVDLPNYEATYLPRIGIRPESILPGGAEPGFVIPDELRHRWHLSLGDSREVFPALLDDLGAIDMSLHDSEHTYECMMFEYSTVLPRLNAGGIVMSDDVHLNNAFSDFCRRESLKPVLFEGRFGAAKKAFER